MKKYLLLSILIFPLLVTAQQSLPPNGCDVYMMLDPDADGFAVFDVEYIKAEQKAKVETILNFDLSGYDLKFYPEYLDDNEIVTPFYTNVLVYQYASMRYIYNGNGPEFTGTGWPNLLSFDCIVLEAVALNGDEDDDTILNQFEDLNGNGFLNDDDTDNDGAFNAIDDDDDNDGILTVNEDYNNNGNLQDDDLNNNGIPDYRDMGVLANVKFEVSDVSIYPNPATSTVIIAAVNIKVVGVSIFDSTGKKVAEFANFDSPLDVSQLASGVYFIKLQSDSETAVKKLIIE